MTINCCSSSLSADSSLHTSTLYPEATHAATWLTIWCKCTLENIESSIVMITLWENYATLVLYTSAMNTCTCMQLICWEQFIYKHTVWKQQQHDWQFDASIHIFLVLKTESSIRIWQHCEKTMLHFVLISHEHMHVCLTIDRNIL